MAVTSISKFGPQAELMFIEGLTKDKNPLIRQECAKGLGNLGVQNFRALLFGLRDYHDAVRKTTSITIKHNFFLEQILEEFQDKPNQLPALLCNIKDIFLQPFPLDQECRALLQQILFSFGEPISYASAAATASAIIPQNLAAISPASATNKTQKNFNLLYPNSKQAQQPLNQMSTTSNNLLNTDIKSKSPSEHISSPNSPKEPLQHLSPNTRLRMQISQVLQSYQ